MEVRALLVDMLEMLNHRVETADSGQDALTRLAAQSYDVILTDVQMEGMDGIELYRRIEEQWPKVASRVAFVTGREPIEFGAGEAPVPTLTKPFSFESLEAVLATLLARDI